MTEYIKYRYVGGPRNGMMHTLLKSNARSQVVVATFNDGQRSKDNPWHLPLSRSELLTIQSSKHAPYLKVTYRFNHDDKTLEYVG